MEPKSEGPEEKHVLKIADGMIASWSKCFRVSVLCALPILLIAYWLGAHEFVLGLIMTASIGVAIIWSHYESGRFFCRKCSTQLIYQSKWSGPMQFKCPDCRTIYDTDCQIDYAGGPPRKVG